MSSATAEKTAAVSFDAESAARYMRVLGDPTRLRIVEVLLEQDRTVSELVELLELPQSRVSNHLACLRWCRVVDFERDGRSVIYRVRDRRISRILGLAWTLAEPNCDHLRSCSRIGPEWV